MGQFFNNVKRITNSFRFRMLVSKTLNPYFWAVILGRRLCDKNLIVVVGSAHRTGSTWLYQMLNELGGFKYELEYERGYYSGFPQECCGIHTLRLDNINSIEHLRRLKGRRLFKAHYAPKFINNFPDNLKIITMHRDCRDVLVSAAFFLSNLSEQNGGFSQSIRQQSIQQKIKFLINSKYHIQRMEEWFYLPNTYKIYYEELKTNTIKQMKLLCEYLNLKVNDERIKKITDRHSFQRRSRRMSGEENIKSFLRKGISGDWKNYFDEECIRAFKTSQNGRWNKLLVEMGYESTLDW